MSTQLEFDFASSVDKEIITVMEKINKESSGAWKLDNNKLRVDLVFPESIEEIARVFSYGAAKYGSGNWDKGMHWGRLYAATMRHLLAWWRGEEFDKESGLLHLSHAASNLCTLIYYSKRNRGTDDRNI